MPSLTQCPLCWGAFPAGESCCLLRWSCPLDPNWAVFSQAWMADSPGCLPAQTLFHVKCVCARAHVCVWVRACVKINIIIRKAKSTLRNSINLKVNKGQRFENLRIINTSYKYPWQMLLHPTQQKQRSYLKSFRIQAISIHTNCSHLLDRYASYLSGK